jgi:hypothetical protein
MVEDVPDADEVEDQFDEYDRLSASTDVHKNAWSRTLDDMRALADERRDDGWEVVTVHAGDTSPAAADADVTDTHGLTYVVGAGDADAFRDAFEQGEFPEYDVYRQDVDGRVFVVTELRDPDSETIILVAGNFWRHQAGPMVQQAKATGKMYTHVRKLDKTHLGSFEHDGYQKFFPEADRIIDDWQARQ